MASPTFGITILPVDEEPRPALGYDMSIVGLVGTAPDADIAAFPVNTPVLLFSNDPILRNKLGATGTLPYAVDGVDSQLGEFQVSARVVIVRVAEGADEAATIVNLLGNQGSQTGMWALKRAGSALAVVPRLISIPGYTASHQVTAPTGSVSRTTKTGGNTGNGTLTLATPAYGASIKNGVYTVRAKTATTFEVKDPDGINMPDAVAGSAYTGAHVRFTVAAGATAFEAGDGFDLTATVTPGSALANPIVAALPPLLNGLLAHAVVQGPTSSYEAWSAWRETFADQRIIPLAIGAKVGPLASVVDASPSVIGIGVARDHQNEGTPFKSWANQAVAGIVGPDRDVEFSLTDGSTEGQTILSQNGGIIVRGAAGIETAIADAGFVYIGTDTASDNELWRFYNVSRGRDYFHIMLLRTCRHYLGKFNITVQTIEAIRLTMEQIILQAKARGWIIDGRIGFTAALNTAEELRQGKFTIDFQAEEPPVLRHLTIRSMRYRAAFDTLLEDLASQFNTVLA